MRRNLEEMKMDWEDLHVNALFHGLPSRFHHLRNEQFGGSARKTAADIELTIANIDAAASYFASSSPAALAVSVCRSDETLTAFYTRLSCKWRQPSAAHPCARCGSPDHWVVSCPSPPVSSHPAHPGAPDSQRSRRTQATSCPMGALRGRQVLRQTFRHVFSATVARRPLMILQGQIEIGETGA